MITEDYVSYEVAKLLKEKGFDEPCDNYYDQSSDEPQQLTLDELYYSYDEFLKAPTHQMAMKWLREVHKLRIVIEPVVSDDDGDAGCLWSFRISRYIEPIVVSTSVFETYAEATEEAIKYSLENLI